MSLRVRLNILITLLFLSLFFCSSFFIISNARETIHNEVKSTAELALQLIQIAVASASIEDDGTPLKLLNQLSNLDETRHLHIRIQNSSKVLIPAEDLNTIEYIDAPKWFIKLVEPPETELKRWLYNPAVAPTGVIIKADPGDEIEESWVEVRNMLIFLLIFIILANVMVYFATGRYLSPIDTILDGMSDIQKGNYEYELPSFDLPELERISQRFNHMVKVLSKSKAENQHLTQRLLEIQEEERRNLAQELHDELGQTITAIKAITYSIINSGENKDERLKTVIEYSDHTYNTAKNMMHRLRPSALDDLGLIKALQNMVDDWNSRQGEIFCHFSFSDIPDDLSESLNINIFRIIQESLTNVLKHSKADEVKIELKLVENDSVKSIALKIIDNGVGFEKETVQLGFGLSGIKERVELNRGVLNLDTSPQHGLKLDIMFPLDGEKK